MAENRNIWYVVIAIVIVVIIIGAAIAVSMSSGSKPTVNAGTPPTEMVTYAKDWPLANKDYNNSRATTGSTIDSSNVATLGLAWSHPLKAGGAFGVASSTPLILGNDVYFQDVTANVYDFNLLTGALKWSVMYNSSATAGPNGPAAGYGKLFVAKDPYNVSALNISTGTELWSTQISHVAGTGIDIQPIAYDGLVYVSTVPGTGDRFYGPGGIGVIYALDQATGKIMWNFSTVQNNDLWGHPEVNSGGGCWYSPAVDTRTGSMFWGIGNPAPFAGAPGWPSGSSYPEHALYTDSIVSLDHNNGNLQWYSQALSHDIWDHDLQISPILATANVSGKVQDIALGAGKMGNVFCFNRTTGAIQWKIPVGMHQNDYLDPLPGPTTVLPGVLGGVETPMAYANGILYVPVIDLSTQYTPTGLNGSSINFGAGKGELVAIDVEFGHILWTKYYDTLNVGGATVVNDVVMTASFDGIIYGYNAKTGAELFVYPAPAGINAWPAIAGNTVVWPCGAGLSPALIALRLGATPPNAPKITISSPHPGTSVVGPNITVNVTVTHFNLVNKLGNASVAGEGHIHYFLDVTPPTAPGIPALTANGTWAASVNTSYTWVNVTPGLHTFSAELVNNDHTPLVPPAVAVVSITVVVAGGTSNVYLKAQGIAFNRTSISVPAGSTVVVHFQNMDSGIPHNFAVYTDSSATTVIFQGPTITGVSSTTYTFTAPLTSGTYYFRCDVHPTMMNGSFIVT